MAMKSRASFSFLRTLQFLLRFLGLNGLIAAAVGLVLWQALDQPEAGLIVLIAGAGAVGLALLGEVRGMAGAVASHRGFAGTNVLLQIALAVALVVGGNIYSFSHYKRFDCTKDQTFTLPDTIREKLAQMRGDTDIIIYIPHISFGQRAKLGQDEHDQAAEKIISKKVEDLAEQFSELGPRFRVHVFDKQKRNSKEARKKINLISGELTKEQLASNDNPTKDKPAVNSDLLKTVENAAENSIFFYSQDRKNLQRLGFSDMYQVDKKASEEANDKQGNLVLIDRGIQNFADKIFKIEEKKPRIGFAVVHEWLGLEGTEKYGMIGLREALPTRDFDGRDIVLWKELQDEPDALERDESLHERLETSKRGYERDIKELEEEQKEAKRLQKYWETTSLEEINKEYTLVLTVRGPVQITRKELEEIRKATGRLPATLRINEEYKAQMIKEWPEDLEEYELEIEAKKKQLAKVLVAKSKLRVENLAEQRRLTDVRQKFKRLATDLDMLVIPRWTLSNLLQRDAIPGDIYPMADAHIEAIKDFMKTGKPVLFLLGPMFDRFGNPTDKGGQDSLEKLLSKFNIELPNQAVLFTSEGEAMEENRERRGGPGGASVDIPPALFEWKRSTGSRGLGVGDKAAPPIRASMKLTLQSLGDNSSDGLKIRHARPVYVVRSSWSPETVTSAVGAISLGWPGGTSQALGDFITKVSKKSEDKAVILMSDPDSWNEGKPFQTPTYVPRFKRTKNTDADKGTVLERRRGPFPIGIALETEVPREWYQNDTSLTPQKIRIAVIGQGGLFAGEKLSPMREKFFLDVSNWLLGRENLLARESKTWQYPRVKLEPEMKNLWEWGARLGLPLLFVCLGLNVWLVRRMR